MADKQLTLADILGPDQAERQERLASLIQWFAGNASAPTKDKPKKKSKTLRRFRAERYVGALSVLALSFDVQEFADIFQDTEQEAQEALDQLVRTHRISTRVGKDGQTLYTID